MILEETVNKLVRDIVNLILETPGFAIRGEQNAPRPAGVSAPLPVGDYATVDFVSDVGVGLEEFTGVDRTIDPDIDRTTSGLRELMVSVGFYRDNSVDNARRVHLGLAGDTIRGLLHEGGLGLIRRSAVRRMSERLKNGWEERAQFDIFLSAVASNVEVIKSILSMDIAGAFHSRGLIYDFTIEVQ